MQLLPIIEHYQESFLQQYGNRLTSEQRQALHAMQDCRTAQCGEMRLHCQACDGIQSAYHSCGHRACPRCQHHDTARWLDRQQRKLLPVRYFMVTFTLPAQLRPLAWQHQKSIYAMLFDCAVGTLKDFGINSRKLGGDLGMTAVLHTHSRRLDYHPHVHIVIPGGSLNKARKQWRKLKGKYLFNHKALAKVFRARLLAALQREDFTIPRMPASWVVDCKQVGKGLPALTYLARYLYRGVISENNILHDDGEQVTFRYKDGQTGEHRTRTVSGEQFLWLLLRHVLPKGFRRVRDFGFLHGNARKSLRLLQWLLNVAVPEIIVERTRPMFLCAHCHKPMAILAFIPKPWRFG